LASGGYPRRSATVGILLTVAPSVDGLYR
jgi:hypothetical protein